MDRIQEARAREALNTINQNHKRENVIRQLKKDRHEIVRDIVTQCMVYNATGETLKYVSNHDFSGRLVQAATPKPNQEIKNGEWHYFLHGGDPGNGSEGAVVYRAQWESGKFSDVMLAWHTPGHSPDKNKVYTEVRGFDNKWNWSAVQTNLNKEEEDIENYHKFMDFDDHFQSVVITNPRGHNPIFEGIITSRNAKVHL